MSRRLLPLALVALVLCARGLAGQSLRREEVARLKAATVFVALESRSYLTGELARSSGSGFLIDEHGHVATNWHVVRPVALAGGVLCPARTSALRVHVHSGTPHERVHLAHVVAVDAVRDLAILSTAATGEAFVALADSGEAYETSPVWAFGFPLGDAFAVLEKGPEVSVVRGAITALRHDERGALRLIQTDAPFQPGSSGGPLVDERGQALGVPVSILGDTRINFAIPSTHLAQLMASVPRGAPLAGRGVVSLASVPAGAQVYVDGVLRGRTAPGASELELECGWRQLTLALAGHRSWVRDLCLRDGLVVGAELEPLEALRIEVARHSRVELAPARAPLESAAPDVLLRASFDDPTVLAALEQSTGGTDARTWYVRDGALHQHESSGALHAIFLGERGWSDYSFAADVRIETEANDSRAGLVFREDERGFYLFRIHRESDRAQLAYHTRSPFGWFVLAERALALDVAGESHRLEVRARGERIACLLDGATLIETSDRLSARGRVGFYSVESQASFDDALVTRSTAEEGAAPVGPGYLSFWFQDRFDSSSRSWSARFDDGTPAEPWILTELGGVDPAPDARERVRVLESYELTRFDADLVATLGPARADGASTFGIAFGVRAAGAGSADYRLLFSPGGGCRLVARTGGEQVELARGDARADAFDGAARLALSVRAGRVECALGGELVLAHEWTTGRALEPGRLAIVCAGVPVVLHELRVAGGP